MNAKLKLQSLLLACLIACAAGSALKLHGFSLSAWRWILDGPSSVDGPTSWGEILKGKPQLIRSDDWSVVLALSIAQASHKPAFPSINTQFGFGQNMWVVPTAPILHPLTLFRPQTWGYFISPSFGVAWQWNVYVFGFIAGFTAFFFLVLHARMTWAVLMALALLWSPFFQYWSLNSSVLAASAAGLLACIVSRRMPGLAIWLAGVFALTLYPPFQIPWIFIGLSVVLAHRAIPGWRFLLLAGAILGGCAIVFWQNASEAIQAFQNTVYPGNRLSTGGQATLREIFRGNVLPVHALVDPHRVLNNPCEAASFLLISPIVLLALWVRGVRLRSRLWIGLWITLGTLLSFQILGWPAWLAHWSMLDRVPNYRSTMAWGVLDACIALLGLITLSGSHSSLNQKRFWAAWALLATGFAACLWSWAKDIPTLLSLPRSLAWVVLLALVHGLFFYTAARRRVTASLCLLALTHFFLSQSFNPIVHDGVAAVVDHPLGQSIRRTSDRTSVWWVFGSASINQYLPMVGRRNLTALQHTPHRQLWQALDPGNQFDHVTRRYAHIFSEIASSAVEPLHAFTPQADAVALRIHPDHPRFLALPVTHLLLAGPWPAGANPSQHWRLLETVPSQAGHPFWSIYVRR